MSFGEAASAGACGLAVPAGDDCARVALCSQGQLKATAVTITNAIRIPVPVQSGNGGKETSLPPSPTSLPLQREDNQGAGILRHALEGLAIERDVLVGHQAA